MKKHALRLGYFVLIALSLNSFTASDTSETFKARTDKSDVVWIARKVGGEHTGTVDLKSGSFEVKDELITSGTFIMDMTTIEITDTESKKLHNHLRSKDFFHVDVYKESKLVITGSKLVEGKLMVSGNLTIRDITNPISFEAVNIGKTENFRIYSSTMSVDRTKYGIVYRSSAVGDTFIKDFFDIKVKITGERKVN